MVNWNSYLVYRMPKTVTIQVWQVGLVHKLGQVGVIVYLIYNLWSAATWAYHEEPGGTTNSWAEAGNFRDVASDYSSLPYCLEDGAYSFTYDDEFLYTDPVCEVISPYEIAVKGDALLHVTTAYIEFRERGYPCASENASGEFDEECDGWVIESSAGQCSCTTHKTVYPVGVEAMNVALTHGYTTTDAFNWWGSSNAEPGSDHAVDTTVLRPAARGSTRGPDARLNNSDAFFASGETIRFSLAEWLDAANVSLDDLNPSLSTAAETPRVRTTGAMLSVTIEYSNRGGDGKPVYPNRRTVSAEVEVEADLSAWAGAGPIAHYEVYPVGASGNQTYEKYFRYRQGVVLRFRSAGRVFKMEWVYLVNILVTSLVLLSAANTIATFFALYLFKYRNISTMIRFDTREKFSVDGRNAELGMKAAIAAAQFDRIDDDDNGLIEMEDLVRSFARIPGVTFEQAAAVSQLVLNIANTEDEQADLDPMADGFVRYYSTLLRKIATRKRARPADASAGDATLSFSEFLRASLGGSMLKWDQYLDGLVKTAAPLETLVAKRLARSFADEQSRHPHLLEPASGAGAGVGVGSRRRRNQRRRGGGGGEEDQEEEEDESPTTGRRRRALGARDGDAPNGGADHVASDHAVEPESTAERLERRVAERAARRRAAHDEASGGRHSGRDAALDGARDAATRARDGLAATTPPALGRARQRGGSRRRELGGGGGDDDDDDRGAERGAGGSESERPASAARTRTRAGRLGS